MKINKINDMIELDDQFDVELEGCMNDCKVYSLKGGYEVSVEQSQGLKGDGTDSSTDYEAFKTFVQTFGYYCYYHYTAKTTSAW